MRHTIVTSLSLALLVAGTSMTAHAASKTNLQAQAKVDMQQARATALKAYPGRIVQEELEQESGGSGLRYSFDIQSVSAIHEVGVDAKTGKVLENSVEGADND